MIHARDQEKYTRNSGSNNHANVMRDLNTSCTHAHACMHVHTQKTKNKIRKYEEAMHQGKCPQGCHKFWYQTTLHFHEIIWLHFTVCALDIGNKRVQQHLPPKCQHPTLQTAMSGLKTMWYPPTECPTRYHELFWPSSKAPGWKANRHGLDSPLQCSFFFKHCGSYMHSDCNCASPQL